MLIRIQLKSLNHVVRCRRAFVLENIYRYTYTVACKTQNKATLINLELANKSLTLLSVHTKRNTPTLAVSVYMVFVSVNNTMKFFFACVTKF